MTDIAVTLPGDAGRPTVVKLSEGFARVGDRIVRRVRIEDNDTSTAPARTESAPGLHPYSVPRRHSNRCRRR
jgi:hypothetical protein